MKFYIASSFKNIDIVRYISEQLITKGYIQTFDWTKHEKASTFEELKQIGEKEKDAVSESDFIVVILPAGKGSHIELGIALGLNKEVILFSPNNEVYDFSATSTFYHISGVTHFTGTIDELVAFLATIEKSIT